MNGNYYYDRRMEILSSKQGDFEDWHTLLARWHNDHRQEVYAAVAEAKDVEKMQADFIQWANHKTHAEIEAG